MMRYQRKYFFMIIVILSCFPLHAQQNEIRSLAGSLAQDISIAGIKTVAVADFTDLQGKPTDLGRYVAEEFAVALTKARKGFSIIDRAHLATLLKEMNLSNKGVIDAASIKKIGEIIGADALLTGTLTEFSESVRITAKVMITNTAQIVAADNIDMAKTQTILELIKRQNATDQNSPGQPNPASIPASGKGAPEPRQTATGQEFVFELVKCSGGGGSVRCSMRITNRGNDRSLMFSSLSKGHDNTGFESGKLTGSIGNSRGLILLVSGVPVDATFSFDKISQTATSFTLLDLGFHVGETSAGGRGGRLPSGRLNIQFRNVIIAR